MSGWGFEQPASAGSRINKRSAAAMELELEMGPGCSTCTRPGASARCNLQGVKARCLSVLSFPSNMEISTAALQGRGGGPWEPRPRTSSTASQCHLGGPRPSANQISRCRMERIEAAEEAHCSLPRPASTASLPGRHRRHHPSCGFRRDVVPNPHSCSEGSKSTLDLDHKPCASLKEAVPSA
jgi:hypothetical protein